MTVRMWHVSQKSRLRQIMGCPEAFHASVGCENTQIVAFLAMFLAPVIWFASIFAPV